MFGLELCKIYNKKMECEKDILEKSIVNFNKAIEYYNKNLEINPKIYDVYKYKAEVLYELERYEESLECFDKFLEKYKYSDVMDEDRREVIFSKVAIFHKLRRYEDALKYLEILCSTCKKI